MDARRRLACYAFFLIAGCDHRGWRRRSYRSFDSIRSLRSKSVWKSEGPASLLATKQDNNEDRLEQAARPLPADG